MGKVLSLQMLPKSFVPPYCETEFRFRVPQAHLYQTLQLTHSILRHKQSLKPWNTRPSAIARSRITGGDASELPDDFLKALYIFL